MQNALDILQGYKLSDDRKSRVAEKGSVYQLDGKSLYWTDRSGKRVLKCLNSLNLLPQSLRIIFN